jgi:hypothetical protein
VRARVTAPATSSARRRPSSSFSLLPPSTDSHLRFSLHSPSLFPFLPMRQRVAQLAPRATCGRPEVVRWRPVAPSPTLTCSLFLSPDDRGRVYSEETLGTSLHLFLSLPLRHGPRPSIGSAASLSLSPCRVAPARTLLAWHTGTVSLWWWAPARAAAAPAQVAHRAWNWIGL